jgi:hypothetical protein
MAALFTLADGASVLNSPLFITVLTLAVGFFLSRHVFTALAAKLRADADHRQGLVKLLEQEGATLADHLEDFIDANGGDIKAIANPLLRARALEHLKAKAEEQVQKTMDDAIQQAVAK